MNTQTRYWTYKSTQSRDSDTWSVCSSNIQMKSTKNSDSASQKRSRKTSTVSLQDLDEIEMVSVVSDNFLDDDKSVLDGLKSTTKEIRQTKIDAKAEKNKAGKRVNRTGMYKQFTA